MDALDDNQIKLEAEPRRVLVIRLSSMGDVVMSTSVLDPLRRAGFEVSFLAKKAFTPLLEHHPDIHEVYVFDPEKGERQARQEFFSWFEARKFDFVLDLQDSWRTRFWRFRLRQGAPVHVAGKERLRELLILLFRLGSAFSFGRGGRARKFRRRALDALASLRTFPQCKGPLTRLAVTEEERAQVRSLLPRGEFAVLLPGSAWKGKEWPYFPELAAVLSRKIPVVALGAEKDEACDEIARFASGHPESCSLRGRTNLRESMAVIAEARWVVGNDTGLIHVAEALGRDVAVLEGPTHEQLGFSPYREKSLLLGLPLVCRPCSKSGWFCPRLGSRKCLRGLSVQAVVARLRQWGLPC
jgi:ADP-heptose:LPS heptosyltransferase